MGFYNGGLLYLRALRRLYIILKNWKVNQCLMSSVSAYPQPTLFYLCPTEADFSQIVIDSTVSP